MYSLEELMEKCSAVFVFSFLYLDLPPHIAERMRQSVPPRHYLVELLNHERTPPELRDLAKEWIETNAPEKPPFRKVIFKGDSNLVGRVGPDVWREFIPLKTQDQVDLEVVKAAVKETVVGSLLVHLLESFPSLCGCPSLPDLYPALLSPETQPYLTYLGKWLYACLREHLILPEFGSVDAFMSTIIRLLREGRGKTGLVTCALTPRAVRKLLPEDVELHKMADLVNFLESEEGRIECLLVQHIDDLELLQAQARELRWTSKDEVDANDMLKQMFPKDIGWR